MYENIHFPGWEVVRKIGEGSFGGVYEIHRTLPDGRIEKAALKRLTVPKDNSEIRELYSQSFSKENITAHYKDQMRELVNEYTLTQELNGCRNVVACHDVQCVQHTDGIGWDIYIRMELLKPLKHVLSADYQEMAVLKLGLSLCNALLACQEHHIVHRDIKPENILVSDRGEFKLGDFGIAKVSEKTATGTMTGTMGYMAPEVANRWHYGAQADIYSLGMVLYWMMNRRTLPLLPFPPAIPTAAQRQEAANRRFAGESFPPPINGSRELKAVVMKACAFSTDKRYQTVRELRQDLYACYQQRRTGKTVDVSIPVNTDETVWTNEPTSGNTYSGNRSFRGSSQNEKTGTLNTDTAKTGTGRFTASPKKKKSHKWVWIPVCILLLCGSVLGIRQAMTAAYNAKQTAYLEAQRLLDEEEYSAAVEAFDALKGFEDSANKAQEARHLQEMAQDYQAAQQLMDDGEYLAAAEAFDALDGYDDSADKAQEARHLQEMAQDYQAAQQLMDDGKYMQAMWAFSALDFRDSAEKVQEAKSKYISNQPALAGGFGHTVGLCNDGTVVATGDNGLGQCSVDSWSDVVAVAAGACHTVGLRSDGTVIATGWNDDGQCDVDSWSDVVAVAAGDNHTVGLRSDGTVIATGWNDARQCDVNSWTDIVAVAAGVYHTVGLRSDGTVIATGWNDYDVDSWTDIVAVAAGDYHAVGLRSDGTVVAAGDNEYGQCNVDNWTDIVAVAAGWDHTVGLRSDGTVVAAGSNEYGQCDVDSWRDIVAVAAGGYHTVGLRSDGTVVAAGLNNAGQCDVSDWKDIDNGRLYNGRPWEELFPNGSSDSSFRGQPTLAAGGFHTVGLCNDGTVVAAEWNDEGQCDVNSWTDIVAVAAGYTHTVGLHSDGTVVATGDNELGQCSVDSWTNILAVAAEFWHTVGLRSDGTVIATGWNDEGQCDVNSWTDIVAVAAGQHHTVGLRSDGTVVATGLNDAGQCDVNSWTDIVAVAAGAYHTVGLRSDGTVVATGWNDYDVDSWTDIVAVAAGDYHAVGLRSDGTVVAAGDNEYGQCNVGSWTDIVAVAAGWGHTVGLRSDGTVVAAGRNDLGQCDVSNWKNIRLPQ